MQRRDSSQIQRSQILAKLINARGARVPLPDILVCAAQYNARIFELRRMGFRIVNERERVNGQLHTWFRLISGPVMPNYDEFPQPKSETEGEPEHTLFGDLSRMRYPD